MNILLNHFFLKVLGFLILLTQVSFAARRASIHLSDVQVYERPKKDSKVIFNLKKGTKIIASNYPLNYFYKIRFSNGMLGWVEEEALALEEGPSESEIKANQFLMKDDSSKIK